MICDYFKSVGKVEKKPMKKGAEGQFYEILEDICDRCHGNALSKKIFLLKTCMIL